MTASTPFALAALTAAVFALPAEAAERRFDLAGFEKIAIGGSDSASVRRGPFSVRAIGDGRDLDRLEVKVEKGTLMLGRKKGKWDWSSSKRVQFEISLPALTEVAVGGSGSINADQGGGKAFAARVGGSGNLAVASVDAATVSVAIGGSGNVKLAGRCTQVDLRIGGSGDADLAGLNCQTASVRIGGSGDARLHVSKTADISKAGSGNVVIAGGARCTSRVAGSGRVDCI